MPDLARPTPPETPVCADETQSRPHSIAEDIYAGLVGCSLIAFGVVMLKHAGLVTGGIAGISLLISYYTHVSATTLFAVINLPFFYLAGRLVSPAFGVKTCVANLAIMAIGIVVPKGVGFADLDPLFAAIFGGSVIGIGILALARHGAGVGGVGVIALALHRSKGWNAGTVLMVCDLVIVGSSLSLLDAHRFWLSVASAAAINGIMIVNHRSGRYVGH